MPAAETTAAAGPTPSPTAPQDMADRAPDVKLINLETAVTTHDRPWPRKGINYRMHPGRWCPRDWLTQP